MTYRSDTYATTGLYVKVSLGLDIINNVTCLSLDNLVVILSLGVGVNARPCFITATAEHLSETSN